MTPDRLVSLFGQGLIIVGLILTLLTISRRVARLESAVFEMQNQIIRLQLGEPPEGGQR